MRARTRSGSSSIRKSPRHVTLENAGSIIAKLPQQIEKVGVFVNQTADQVRDAVKQAGLTTVQLSGGESVEFSRTLFEELANGANAPRFSAAGRRKFSPGQRDNLWDGIRLRLAW